MSGCSTGGSATSKVHFLYQGITNQNQIILLELLIFLTMNFTYQTLIRQNHMKTYEKCWTSMLILNDLSKIHVKPQYLDNYLCLKWSCQKWPLVLQLQQVWEEWLVPPDVERSVPPLDSRGSWYCYIYIILMERWWCFLIDESWCLRNKKWQIYVYIQKKMNKKNKKCGSIQWCFWLTTDNDW